MCLLGTVSASRRHQERPMTAQPSAVQPPAVPRSRLRVIARRTLATVVVVVTACGGGLWKCSADWKDSAYTFGFEGGDYRIRVTGSSGSECVRLEHEDRTSRSGPWVGAGKDCAWPRVAGGDGWLAGGQAERVYDRRAGGLTSDWLFFGIVPAAATEIVLTLDGGVPLRIATREAGKGANRIYAHHQPGVGDRADIVGLELHDAQGGEVRVY